MHRTPPVFRHIAHTVLPPNVRPIDVGIFPHSHPRRVTWHLATRLPPCGTQKLIHYVTSDSTEHQFPDYLTCLRANAYNGPLTYGRQACAPADPLQRSTPSANDPCCPILYTWTTSVMTTHRPCDHLILEGTANGRRINNVRCCCSFVNQIFTSETHLASNC